ncbi:MAG: tandem-95 repeat protein [Gammaproteobacteria bacterium]|nr:tandem-95 repeat protein [Gammaproteobacteria bacterium]MBU1654990.1 tandem-95 repeat protein [Gammaproteobacteria bacterium]MBU1960011.1 tandem-95 repeat protein [Gammaproteobacteria bacterium]
MNTSSGTTLAIGIATQVSGHVTVTGRNGDTRILHAGDFLFEGDMVHTGPGGSASLEFNNGRRMDLGRDSSANVLVVEDPAPSTEIFLADNEPPAAGPYAVLQPQTASTTAGSGPRDESQVVEYIDRTADLGKVDAGYVTKGPGFALESEVEYLSNNFRTGMLGNVDAGYETAGLDFSFNDKVLTIDAPTSGSGPSPGALAPLFASIALDQNISLDDVINAIEKDQDIAITGSTGGDVVPGDPVTISVGGRSYRGPVDVNGHFSIDVPGSVLASNPQTSIQASVTHTNGVGTSVTASDSATYGVDVTAPTLTVDAPDNSSDPTPTITGTTDAPDGSILNLTVTDSNGVVQQLTTVATGGSYNLDVPAVLAEGSYTVSATVTDPAGNIVNAADTGSIDTLAPVPSIALDADIAGDDIISAAESGQDIAITGIVGGDAQVGDTVTLTVNGKTFSGTVQADFRFSIDVPGADLVNDSDHSIDASITTGDAAGNVGTASDTEGYSVRPVALDDSFTLNEDAVLSGTLAGNDSLSGDGGNSFAKATDPAHGVLVVNADGSFTYTPVANYSGPDSFTYSLTDADGDLSTAVVNLTVNPLDDVPVAVDDSFTLNEDAALNGSLAGNDTASGDGGNVWALASNPSHGAVTVNPDGSFSYTPAANYAGPDSFTYSLTDTDGDLSTATVNLTVSPLDDVPVAVDDSFTLNEDAALNGSLAGNDTLSGDGGNVWALAVNPAHGAVTVNADGTFSYTPAANYAGPDSFTYTLTDSDGDLSTATVNLTVSPLDDVPVAVDDSFVLNEDAALNGSLAGNDTASGDGGNVWALAGNPSHGTVTVNPDGSFSYTPAANYAGADSFTYTLTDTDGDVSTATVNLTVDAVNEVVAINDSATTNEDTPVTIPVMGNDSDPEGDTFAVTAATQGANGSVVIDPVSGNPVYSPNADWSGTDSFTYTLTDANGATDTATVSVTVNPVPPVVSITATDGSAVEGSDNSIVFTVSQNEIDGNDTTVDIALNLGEVEAEDIASIAYTDSNGIGHTLSSQAQISDFVTNGGTLKIPAGSTNAPAITITVIDDALLEMPETLSMSISNPVNATLGTASDTAAIADESTAPDPIDTVYVRILNDAALIEDDGVKLSHQVQLVDMDGNEVKLYAGQSMTINLAYSNDTTENADFQAGGRMTQVVILGSAAGVSTATIENTIADDALLEGDEAYSLTIGTIEAGHPFENVQAAGDGATPADGNPMSVTGTIHDDETPIAPTLSGDQTIRLSEEGLADGLADSVGNSDTTDAVVYSGNFAVADANPTDILTLTLSAPAGIYTSNGESISWALSNANKTLTGSTTAGDVLKVDINDAGAYTATLLGPIDHAAPTGPATSEENQLTVDLQVTVNDGTGRSDTSTLSLVIEDDSPHASNGDNIINLEIRPITTNIIFTLDISGSMGSGAGSKYEIARQALLDTINAYEENGPVNVSLTVFSTQGSVAFDWLPSADAKTYITNSLTAAGGWTNYEDALYETMKVSNGGFPPATQTVAYYLSDGVPTVELNDGTPNPDDVTGGNTQDGTGSTYLDDAHITNWTAFIESNNIDLTVIGIEMTDATYLDRVQIQAGKTAILVNDASDLSGTILNQIDLYKDGDLTTDVEGNTLIDFGADGGYLESVTIAGNTVQYDPNNPTQTVAGTHGNFTINFNTGTYRYTVTDTNYVDHTEIIGAEILDNDGDLVDTILLNINIAYDVAFGTAPHIREADTSVVEDIAQVIATATDSNGTIVTNTLNANHGTATLDASGNITYAPDSGYLGRDVVSVSVTDNEGKTSTRNIVVDVITAAENADTPTLTMDITQAGGLAAVNQTDAFAAGLDGWSGTGVTQTSGYMNIDTGGYTASKTFDFGAGYANKTVTIGFTTDIAASSWDGGTDRMQVNVNGAAAYSKTQDADLDSGVSHSFSATLDGNGRLSVQINSNATQSGEYLRVDNFNLQIDGTFEYQVDLNAAVTDPTETLSPITLKALPYGATLEDASRNPITANADGSYTVPVVAGNATVWIVSASAMSAAQIDALTASVTSTQPGSGDIATVEVHGDNGTAVIIDGIVAGLIYETSSGITGYTGADGYFEYVAGDTVVFKLGNLIIGTIDTQEIQDGKVFLQDIAGVERTDLNDNYVENMAVLLQSLDENSNAYDGIVITEAMHQAFAGDGFDLASISEAELRALIELTGFQAVSEEDAMQHVQDMLELHAGIDEGAFEAHLDDDLLAIAEPDPQAEDLLYLSEPDDDTGSLHASYLMSSGESLLLMDFGNLADNPLGDDAGDLLIHAPGEEGEDLHMSYLIQAEDNLMSLNFGQQSQEGGDQIEHNLPAQPAGSTHPDLPESYAAPDQPLLHIDSPDHGLV